MEISHGDSQKKIEKVEKELADSTLRTNQAEAKLKSLHDIIKSHDEKKQQLEQQIDSLNEELTRLNAQGEFACFSEGVDNI